MTTRVQDEQSVSPAPAMANVRKVNGFIPVSCCYLTDSTGDNHCQHPPREVKPLPWTWRARERWWDAREWLARRLAGHRWPDGEES